MTERSYSASNQTGRRDFPTTRWSIIRAASQRDAEHGLSAAESEKSSAALSSLCQTYWPPLYAYVRRRVRDVDEAHDLTQSFFEQLLAKNYLAQADAERGRFRSFLLTAFKHFLSKQWEKGRAAKRGGGKSPLSLDLNFRDSDLRLAEEPVDNLTAEQIYDREWAVTLLQTVMARLREEHIASGKQELFDRLKNFITGQPSESGYADVASSFGSTEAAMKMTAHRMRRRYRELLREEIAETVASTDEVDDEIRCLFALFES